MAFNFDRARKSAQKALKNPLLELIILGSQGSGKSFGVGTLGVKTLYLYGTKESHGPKAAVVRGAANVEPFCIDYGPLFSEEGEPDRAYDANESLEVLREVLKDYGRIRKEGYKAIALDGLGVLESIIRNSDDFKEKCKTTGGKHNTYKEVEATQDIMGEIIGLMKAAQRECDTHIVVTGILDVRETDAFGAVTEASPRLQGFGLAESMNQHFGDIAVVSKMTRNGEVKYKYQFMTDLTKASKDEHGNQKKAMNFSPRLSGIEIKEPIMDADLGLLAKLKREGAK